MVLTLSNQKPAAKGATYPNPFLFERGRGMTSYARARRLDLSHTGGLLGPRTLLGVPPFLFVMAGVAWRTENFQILDHVVRVVPVHMMHNELIRCPASVAVRLLHHLPVDRALRPVDISTVLFARPALRLGKDAHALQSLRNALLADPEVIRQLRLRHWPLDIQGLNFCPAALPY